MDTVDRGDKSTTGHGITVDRGSLVLSCLSYTSCTLGTTLELDGYEMAQMEMVGVRRRNGSATRLIRGLR